MNPYSKNQSAWNNLADRGSVFAKVASDAECADPLGTLDGRGWLPASVRGLEVLCLASGGGWQAILYAVAGARVTVLDLSPSMLALDQREAERRGVEVRILEASMDDMSMLRDAEFDIVHQPVSTCYVPDIAKVYREIARVLRIGGIYISQHKQPTSLQIIGRDEQQRYVIGTSYYHTGPLPPAMDTSYREPGAVEYLHRWEQLVGDLCLAGFVIEAFSEPFRGDPQASPGDHRHRGWHVPPYVRMKARRVSREATAEPSNRPPGLWIPQG